MQPTRMHRRGNLPTAIRHGRSGQTTRCSKPVDYEPLVIAYHNGAAVRIKDVGQAVDSVEDLRNSGYANGKSSVLVIIFRQPGANIIDTVDRIRAVLPQLQAAIPQSINLQVGMDQTVTIRASVQDVEMTLLISVLLVILVVFLFLRNVRIEFHPERRGSGLADRHVRGHVPARLQRGQPLAHGVDDFDGLRGG